MPETEYRNAWRDVARVSGHASLRTRLGRNVDVYPNAIEIRQDGERLVAFTPEEWGEIVQFVGITGVSDS